MQPVTPLPTRRQNFKAKEHHYHCDKDWYLKDLHQESLYGLALVNNSLTPHFKPTNLCRINAILLKEGSNNSQTENHKVNDKTT